MADHLYWEQIHAIMMPMFAPKMLQRYFTETVTAIQEEVVHLLEMQVRGETVQLYQFAREGVFTALTRTIFASRPGSLAESRVVRTRAP